MPSDGELLELWREAGQWWNGEGGLEVRCYLDEEGIRREEHRPMPPLLWDGAPAPEDYDEGDLREEWDIRIRKQRDMKVAQACGYMPDDLALISRRAAKKFPYVPLHALSGYAFGRSSMLAEEVPVLASAIGLPAICLADPLSLMGAVEFAKVCRKLGIKPLVGATVEMEDGGELVLIARTKAGYRSLSTLITECHLDEPRLYPLCNWDRLSRHAEGLICLTGGDGGPIDRLLVKRKSDEAIDYLRRLLELYGRENVFLEIERSFLPWQRRVNGLLQELAERTGVMPVAGGPITHARPEHFPAQDILVCVETLCTVEEIIGRKPDRAPCQPPLPPIPRRALNAERFMRSVGEMKTLFADRPDLLTNTLKVAEMCDDDVLPPRTRLPRLHEDECHVLRETVYAEGMLRHRGIKGRLKKRIDYEIERICRLGFAGHFLVAHDFCRWADEQHILFSGRGSVVDSAVSYCLGFSRIDAFAHNLHFDRFLPEDGSKRPDLDIDFEAARRDDVRNYVTQKYGERNVATVAAFGAYCTRGIVREVGKAMGLPNETIGFLSKKIHGGIRADQLEGALEARPELRGSNVPRERYQWVFRLAKRLMDIPRNVRAHSSGVVISSEPLCHTVPVMYSGAEGVRIIQWDKRSCKGYFDKFDILCLRGQDVLSGTQRLVRDKDPSFRVEQAPIDDPESYRTMRSGKLIGIPQSASPAMRQAHIRLRTENIHDASLVQAGIRPGVGGAVKINELIARRRGKPYSFNHPELEKILGITYGIIVFQEQVDQLLQSFGGYSSGEAEDTRDAIYKRRREGYAESIREEVVERIMSHGHGRELAEEVYGLVSGFQGYGFAQGHALAFAEISIRSIYCAQNFPSEYFAAILNAQPAGYYGPTTLANEARSRGVYLKRPDVNLSGYDFLVEDWEQDGMVIPSGAIRVGLRQVSGLSKITADRILSERACGLYYSVFDFALRVRPERDELERLVLCGALDGMHPNRRALLWAVPAAMRFATGFSGGEHPTLPLAAAEPAIAYVGEDFSDAAKAVRERSILELDIKEHLMAFERERVAKKGGVTSMQAGSLPAGTKAFAVGNPIRLRFPPTQSGKRVVFFDLEDESGLLNVTCFDDVYQRDGHAIITSPYVTVVGEAQDRDGHTAFLAHRVFAYRPKLRSVLASEEPLPITVSDFLVG